MWINSKLNLLLLVLLAAMVVAGTPPTKGGSELDFAELAAGIELDPGDLSQNESQGTGPASGLPSLGSSLVVALALAELAALAAAVAAAAAWLLRACLRLRANRRGQQ